MIGQIIIMNYGYISMLPLYENIRLHKINTPLQYENTEKKTRNVVKSYRSLIFMNLNSS